MDREFLKLGELRELEPHGQFSRWLGDHDILVYRHQDQIKAVSNICPHFGGPVGHHQLKEGLFTCLWHNYQYKAEDGQCVTNKHLCLRKYTLKIENGEIWVRLVEKQAKQAGK